MLKVGEILKYAAHKRFRCRQLGAIADGFQAAQYLPLNIYGWLTNNTVLTVQMSHCDKKLYFIRKYFQILFFCN